MYLDLDTLEYPITEADIKARNPLMSFPEPFRPGERYVLVESAPRPAHDSLTHGAELGKPALVDGAYRETWITRELTSAEQSARVAAVRGALKSAATNARWRAETGGIELPDGTMVRTGIDDQNRVTSVLANAERAGIATVRFKGDGGVWVDLPLAGLEQIAIAIARHVQSCFNAEAAHHAAIDALAPGALAEYDVNAGWP